ncbi:MAG: glutamate/aspartate ABC transporter substrate-binding protein [Betaproteobacteria bacterium]|nr:glutamate/aspartate ABC transporter substrate-binding protein [Betaproteobacteria bacterium]
MKTARIAFALLASLGLVAAAHAQELTGTLKKIKDTGTITLAVRESSIPFSYYDNQQNTIGYSYDIALQIVDAVKKDLGLAQLAVKRIPVTPANRIQLIQNGTVDLECGSTTNNTARQKQVDFSDTIFIIGTRLLVNRSSGIKDFADLAGKNVVTTAGTTSEEILRKMNEEKKMGMHLISAKDHGESFLTLQSGRAVAFMMDDALLYGERAKARNPSDWIVVGTPQSKEAYGCMLRKGDAPFKKLADATIARIETSGEAAKLYHKWFQSPIPPKGLNLDFPMSEDVVELYTHPNDKAFQ